MENIGAKADKQNPALTPFEPLVGEWQTAGTHPLVPDVTLHGRVVFEWIHGGAFLQMRSELAHESFPDGIAIFGSDDAAGTLFMIYFDERGISRKYDVVFSGNELKWWRNDPKLSQRYTVTVQQDKLVGKGEMSQNGGAWGDDLSLTYIRHKA